MNCRKITLKNNTSNVQVYRYQECSDLIIINESEIRPNQIKTIWPITGTFSSAAIDSLTIIEDVVFPLTPVPTRTTTPTPTQTLGLTQTPTNTPTNTITPSITPTITPTPSPTYSLGVFNTYSTDVVEFSGLTFVDTSYNTTFGSFPLLSGQYLYGDVIPNSGVEIYAGITDDLSSNYQIEVYKNGSLIATSTPGPGTGTFYVTGPITINSGDNIKIYLTDF